jgi:hypothetical protein
VELKTVLEQYDGVVLYFTMWCPTCDSHMSHMRRHLVPDFPNVKFFVIDYVSGSVSYARDSQIDNGYAGPDFEVLVDTDQTLVQLFRGTMGITVLLDYAGRILLNEDYRNGSGLKSALLDFLVDARQ